MLSMNQRARLRKFGRLSHNEVGSCTEANTGRSPTAERARTTTVSPFGLTDAIVEEPVLLVPQPIHRGGDRGEMLEELGRDVLVGPVMVGEAERHLEHVEAVFRHPRGAVGLLEHAPAGQRRRAVEGSDVVEPEKPALEHVVAERVLAVHPPGEIDQELVEDAREEVEVLAAVDPEHRQRRPGVNRRIDVGKVPFVGGKLAVRIRVPFAEQEQHLMLRRRRIDVGEHDAVEREVPGGEPRVLPRVRHGDDVVGVEMPPSGVAPGRGGRRAAWARSDRRRASARR